MTIRLDTPEGKMLTRIMQRAAIEIDAAMSALKDAQTIAEVDALKAKKRYVPEWQLKLYLDAQVRQGERLINKGWTNKERKKKLLFNLKRAQRGD